jgi:hypothetical protein
MAEGHAEGLPHGFWLGLQHKSCPTFMQHNSQTISTNPLPFLAQNRHLIHQALFVGSASTSVGSSLWQRDNGWVMQKVCLMGFGLDFSKSCPTFMQQHNSQKLITNPLPWAHMSENQIITNRHYYAQFLLLLWSPKSRADCHS